MHGQQNIKTHILFGVLALFYVKTLMQYTYNNTGNVPFATQITVIDSMSSTL